jgi:hypothetical protein
VLDLSNITGRLDNIEVLDLTNAESSTLQLALSDVLELGAGPIPGLPGVSGPVVLVNGDVADQVELNADLAGMSPIEATYAGANYSGYQAQGVTLLVHDELLLQVV